MKHVEKIWAVLRLLFGWTFLWAFTDKVFGLGFATEPGKGWIDGGSPTYGFLQFATKGPFAEFYQSLSGSVVVEWLFMLGLLFVGVTLLLGIMVKLGALAGMALYLSFYTAGFIPPEHNPFIDEHIINAVIMLGLFVTVPSEFLGLGKSWKRQALVRRYRCLV
ncbi:MAG: DoxX family membrane protein [Candidatus Kaiserbacteria bacterium]|nr:DoxX family membrane protein [Candidatus Kaiserbacteria bacterium]MCB9816663.1 DoxX family membrane protein [Candidatus Nomurabacteria bacterium]